MKNALIWRLLRRHYWWLAPLLVADIIFFRWLYIRNVERQALASDAEEDTAIVQRSVVPPGLVYGYPTAQTDLTHTNDPTVFMPTASGRVSSALYGSVRTVQRGGRVRPSFHEGIDVAPLRRDIAGRPLDTVQAVADGRVAYINSVAGNSTYGVYVVMTHDDRVGEIYTLYSHLAGIEDGVATGSRLRRGQVLGRMGNTASSGIPMVRAHLHFEIGVINNRRFDSWYRDRDLIPDHGVWHGWNLTGIDPLVLFREDVPTARFCMADYLSRLTPAFVLVFAAESRPDYFRRYPRLWHGAHETQGAIRMAVSEGGVPLRGRAATEEERGFISGPQRVAVLDVEKLVLGRNGLRLVVPRGEGWALGPNGERWLEIITWMQK